MGDCSELYETSAVRKANLSSFTTYRSSFFMATWLSCLIATIAAYVGMEFMAWFTHKFDMHGFLWRWH